MKTFLAGFILCLALFTTSQSLAAATRTTMEPYIMGIFPFVPTANIEAIFAPLAAELSRALGKPVKLRSAPSFDKFSDELKSRTFDFAFIQPFDYVGIAKPGGYLPLAARNEILSSHIVVKNDSAVRTLRDLKGKSLGMPPKAAAVSYLNRITLKKSGLTPDSDVRMVYLASHLACLQQMMIGSVDACGVSAGGMRLGEMQLKTTFRLIHKSPEIPAPLFAVKKELPENDRDTIRKVLISTDLAGVKPELRNMFLETGGKPFRTVTDKEYDVVRALMKSLGPK